MTLIDTHTHLYLEQFDEDREAMVQRAIAAGVAKMYLPNVDSRTTEAMLQLEAGFPEHCFAMMGLHPCSVDAGYEDELALVESWLARRAFCAVGEIGLDLYWDKTFYAQQQEAFRRQIGWAKSLGIPVVIHTREAMTEAIAIVREAQDGSLRGVFHCFGGTVEEGRQIIDLGLLLGIGGVLTYKKSGLDETVRQLPLSSLILETDAPYLTPAPYRGKRNESAYLTFVAEKLAAAKEVSVSEIATVTTANAEKLFAHSGGIR